MLEQNIAAFRSYYEFSFKSLITALNEAAISHYSSGCGTKRVTFDIFPAAIYVQEMLSMLTLKRAFKTRIYNGFRDALGRTEYNPAQDFILYMKRWSLFAEQAMRTEGASARGIAAARAKLIMADLIERLGEGKTGTAARTTRFAKLLFDIGKALDTRIKQDVERQKASETQHGRNNYLAAMHAAGGNVQRESLAS